MSQLSGGTQIAGQQLFSASSVPQHVLGELVHTADGRMFRYCKVGASADLVPGRVYSASAEDTSNLQDLTCAVSSAGATTITTTSTVTLTENQCAGGLLVITEGSTGAGQTLRIKSHPAATAAVVTFTLEDPVVTATTGTVKIDVTPNVYSGVIISPITAKTSSDVGVAVYPVPAGQYGWLQTHGPCGVRAQGTVTVGTQLVSTLVTTAGTVVPLTGVQMWLGHAITGIASTECGMVNLQID